MDGSLGNGGKPAALNVTEITNVTFLIDQTHKQNALLRAQITQNDQMNISYETVSTYNQQKYETLAYYNNILFWTYYVFWAFLVLVLFLFGGGAYSLTASLLFTLFFSIYPLISNYCIYWIKYIYHYLAAFIFNTVFNSSSDTAAQTHPNILSAPKKKEELPTTPPFCVVPTPTVTAKATPTVTPTYN
jgi:hypothetical protein